MHNGYAALSTRKLVYLVLVTAYFSITAPTVLSMPNDTIILQMDNRAPFHYLDDNKKKTGNAYHVVVCAMKTFNRPFDIEVVPWQRAQSNTQRGKADAFFAASHNNKRDQYAELSEIIAEQNWNWYFLKGKKHADPMSDDFKNNMHVASWHGSNSSKWLVKNNYQNVSTPTGANELLQMLLSDHIDAAFGSDIFIKAALQEVGAEGKVTEVQGLFKPMGVYFSKDFLNSNDGFLKQFNQAVKTCRQP